MKALLTVIVSTFLFTCFGQTGIFDQAYIAHPQLPKGLLEAVAWSNTRMTHLNNQEEGCSGYPKAYGIMGLHDDGKGYFRENGAIIATYSGISIPQQKSSASLQIVAYASAYEAIRIEKSLVAEDPMTVREVLHELSEIPDSGYVNFLAREMQVYEVLRFLTNVNQAQQYNFPVYHIDLEDVFGSDNYAVLSSEKISFVENGIRSNQGVLFTISPDKSTQYGPAIWNPAPACNFSFRNGVAVSAITIHTVQGTYAGAISWAQNCASSVSYHYVVRSVDGQITQMVLEEDKGWHVGSENPYTIGYEHEGYVDNPAWYTEAMYINSADLSRDIVNSGYGISGLRTYYGPSSAGLNTLGGCTRIKGHQHYPNQSHTDPGINWNWEKYYKLINNTFNPTVLSSASGTLTDSGGSGNNYTDDERLFWLIQPSNAASIQLNFTAFALEANYDYLYIYDGANTDATLIGIYTGTTSPGMISSTGGSLLLEFRSDCSTVNSGWVANYTATLNDVTAPTTAIITPMNWKTDDFTVSFADSDLQGSISARYFMVAQYDLSTNEWLGLDSNVFEDFSVSDSRWTNVTGSYSYDAGSILISDASQQNSNTFVNAIQTNQHEYVYIWDQTFESSLSDQRAGLHFFCDDPLQSNRGNSYFVYLRESDDLVHIYKVTNNVFSLESSVPYALLPNTNYNVKTTFDPISGWIKVYINGEFVSSWQDLNPHSSGSALSFRTGGCSARFDNLMMFRNRTGAVSIPVGIGEEISQESLGAVPTVSVYSIVQDDAGNWSSQTNENYLIDLTAPLVDQLNDGQASDIDTVFTTTLEGNWLCNDPHSGIGSYSYAIGTLPQLNNVVDWTTVGLSQSMQHILSNPIYGQTYYLSIKATNGAGLEELYLSDGQKFLEGLGIEDNFLQNLILFPNPTIDYITVSGLTEFVEFELYELGGKLVSKGSTNGIVDLRGLSSGNYNLRLSSGNTFVIHKIIKQ